MVAITVLCGLLAALSALVIIGSAPRSTDHRAADLPATGARALGPPPSSRPFAPDALPPLEGEAAIARNAHAPFLTRGPAAASFRFAGTPAERLRARTCLAAAMYYEAGDDGIGQLAVGQVVLNRVRHPAFPANVCGVVIQGSERATGCQFTFTCDGALGRMPSGAARTRALVHADLMLNGMVFAGVGLATHYHTTGVYPWWSGRLEKIAQVGSHLFFRWPGAWGRPIGSRRPGIEAVTSLFAAFDPAGAARLAIADPRIEPEPVALMEATQPRPSPGLAMAAAPGEETSAARAIPASRRLPGRREAPHEPAVTTAVPGGHRLLRMFPDRGVYFLHIAAQSSERSRRRTAEALCGGRSTCRVYGWLEPAMVPIGPEVPASARQAAAFAYTRDPIADLRALPPSAAPL
ncbi:MAG: cell wall hydrolase [Sphingobium sp.]